ncbi:DUF4439 domain-containing protein [Ornithinimicrobium pratense]|uniref:DUF4439 domain-containing protein n=1 Tax=Ornithinimicrobium pratense TaxID=2593973 RepID=A0A5J6V4Q6_9MICO|nr:DUF4439 domain-containing protein [Ornithinimicrobium pratense]QFG68929.1 DUF4439 domain-containing protein [Ornithinimicrobium pratense]
MIPVMPSTGPSRRALLRAGLAGIASVGLLAGCSGDRARTPWSPEPTADEAAAARRTPDGDLLLRARERLAGHRAALSRAHADTPEGRAQVRTVAELWQTQQERLEQLILLGGIPLPELDAEIRTLPEADDETDDEAATTGPGPDDARHSATGPSAQTVGEQLRGGLPQVLEDLSRSSALNRAMLVSLAAQHVESARLFGAPAEWPPLEGPVGAAAVPVLARTRPTVFGLEVVAARSRGEERLRYESVLAAVRSTTRALTTLAGDAAPLPPLGYDLPEPLDDEPGRLTLARALVRDIEPAVLSVVARAGSDVEQLRSLVRLLAQTQQWADELDVDPDPFPGMTLP